MADGLALTVAQPAVVGDDLAGNAEAHAVLIRAAPGAGVVVFPELSLTGYRLDAAAVDPADPRLGPVVEACRQRGTLALVGAPTTGPLGDHLSVLAIGGDGVRVVYDKMFLGGEERERFRAGLEPAVVEVGGWRLGLAVCRDTGVAEHAEVTAGLGVDAYVAGVCEHAADRAIIGQRAQRIARANGVWVGVASFAGSTGHGYDPAAGRSGIWRPGGGLVDQAGPEPGRSVSVNLRR